VSGLAPTETAAISRRFDPVAVTVWFHVKEEPLPTDAPPELGPTASRNTPGGGSVVETVTEAVAVCVSEPLTPVIVNGYVPTGVLAPVVTARVDDPVAGFGVKLPVAPVGNPFTLSVTVLLKPLIGARVTV
jgi:hypothetical protein